MGVGGASVTVGRAVAVEAGLGAASGVRVVVGDAADVGVAVMVNLGAVSCVGVDARAEPGPACGRALKSAYEPAARSSAANSIKTDGGVGGLRKWLI